jgi:hypothetical protein
MFYRAKHVQRSVLAAVRFVTVTLNEPPSVNT